MRRPRERDFRVEYVARLAPGDSLSWEIEALEGDTSVTDEDASIDGADKKGAYGSIQQARIVGVGNAASPHPGTPSNTGARIASGDGSHGAPWRSRAFQPAAGDRDAGRTVTFRPDMGKHPHEPVTYKKRVGGTRAADVPQRNPRVGYRVTAVVNGNSVASAEIQMDEIDALRQEYITHNRTVSEDGRVEVPERDEFVAFAELPPTPGDNTWGSKHYAWPLNRSFDHLLNRTMVEIYQALVQGWSSLSEPEWGDDKTSAGPENQDLVVTSAYRNPERNEHIGGSETSAHMQGKALDIVPRPQPDRDSDEHAVFYGNLWQMVENGTAASTPADEWFLEDSGDILLRNGNELSDENDDGIPELENKNAKNVMRDVDHLHLEDDR